MKKTVFFRLLFVGFVVLLSSCTVQEENLFGDLTLQFIDKTRAIDANISLDTVSYKITFSGPNGESESSTADNKTASVSRKGMAVGEWTVTVDALNADSVIIGSGSTKVEIKKGTTTTANITVTELEGEGTLSVTIYSDNPNGSTYTLEVYKNDSGTDTLVKSQAFSPVDSVLKADVTLPNGYYIIKIVSSTESEQCPVPETVRIVKGDKVSASYTITEGEGGISVAIKNLISHSHSLGLSFSSSIPHVGDSITVTATGMVDGSYKYEWYLDSTRETGDASSITLSSLTTAGDYSVTCVVRDTESSLTWSVSRILTVYDASYKPQTITVNGEVEFYLASDVLVPDGTNFAIQNKQTGDTVTQGRHSIYSFSSETEIIATLTNSKTTNFDSYTYYFEKKMVEGTDITLVYVVIDCEIDNCGYINVESSDIGVDLSPKRKVYFGRYLKSGFYVPYLPYNDNRTLKIEPATYSVSSYSDNSITKDNWQYILTKTPTFDVAKVVVKEGETYELSFSCTYKTFTFKSSLFKADWPYQVWLLKHDGGWNWSYIYAENSILDVNITLGNYDYDELLIWDRTHDNLFRIPKSEFESQTEINATFNEVAYVDSGETLPTGRIKIETDSETLLPEDFTTIFWQIRNTSNTYIYSDHLTIWEDIFNITSESRFSFLDLLERGYDVTVKTSTQTDSVGEYTLVACNINEKVDDYGTLVVEYELSGIDIEDANNRSAIKIKDESNESFHYILINDTETKTLKIQPGTYTYYSYWKELTDTSDNNLKQTIEPKSFAITSGETTTITVKLEEKN